MIFSLAKFVYNAITRLIHNISFLLIPAAALKLLESLQVHVPIILLACLLICFERKGCSEVQQNIQQLLVSFRAQFAHKIKERIIAGPLKHYPQMKIKIRCKNSSTFQLNFIAFCLSSMQQLLQSYMKNCVWVLIFNHTDKEVNNYKLCKIDVVCRTEPTNPCNYEKINFVVVKLWRCTTVSDK